MLVRLDRNICIESLNGTRAILNDVSWVDVDFSFLDVQSPTATLEAAMAKRFATDTNFQVANDAMQLLGGYGYLRDYPIERVFRDLRVLSILEGTNEIMRLVISKAMNKLLGSE